MPRPNKSVPTRDTETTLTDPRDWVHVDGKRSTTDFQSVCTPDGTSIVFLRHFPGSASISGTSLYAVNVATGEAAAIGGGSVTGLDVHPDGDTAITQSWMITHPQGLPYLTEFSLTGGTGEQIDVPEGSPRRGMV